MVYSFGRGSKTRTRVKTQLVLTINIWPVLTAYWYILSCVQYYLDIFWNTGTCGAYCFVRGVSLKRLHTNLSTRGNRGQIKSIPAAEPVVRAWWGWTLSKSFPLPLGTLWFSSRSKAASWTGWCCGSPPPASWCRRRIALRGPAENHTWRVAQERDFKTQPLKFDTKWLVIGMWNAVQCCAVLGGCQGFEGEKKGREIEPKRVDAKKVNSVTPGP